jgi:hypothetical protein
VPFIVIGFRNDAGHVARVSRYRTSELPDLARQYWDERRCLNFLKHVLEFVKSKTVEGRIYTLSFRAPFASLELEEVVFANENDYAVRLNRIVPEKYHAFLQRMKTT